MVVVTLVIDLWTCNGASDLYWGFGLVMGVQLDAARYQKGLRPFCGGGLRPPVLFFKHLENEALIMVVVTLVIDLWTCNGASDL